MEVKQVKNKQFIRLVFKLLFTKNVLVEFLNKVPKDKKRKVCSKCHELGHGITSILCKINIDKNNKLKNKIKEHILSKDLLTENNFEELRELSKELNISFHLCQKLYYEIPWKEFIDRKINIDNYLDNLKKLEMNCFECNKIILNIESGIWKSYTWKGNKICDNCYSQYENEREILREKIILYKPIQCNFCKRIKEQKCERFHYDHLNMFEKDNSICSMICDGLPIEEIYREIDKCQILCLSCHYKVTNIEMMFGFQK